MGFNASFMISNCLRSCLCREPLFSSSNGEKSEIASSIYAPSIHFDASSCRGGYGGDQQPEKEQIDEYALNISSDGEGHNLYDILKKINFKKGT